MHPQTERWIKNEDFQNFMRQVHVDIYVGVKNGFPYQDALDELAEYIRTSVTVIKPKDK